jgi:hypothetical protein
LPTFNGVPVAKVEAIDPDQGLEDSTLTYSIMGGNQQNLFKIHPQTGLVQVAGKELQRGQYNLDLTVTDGKFNDRKLLTIDIEKSDNSGLAFAKQKYFASVLENSTKSDQVLVIVTVLGADLNENLRFSILNLDEQSSGLFSIGETSGALKTTGIKEVRETFCFVCISGYFSLVSGSAVTQPNLYHYCEWKSQQINTENGLEALSSTF